MQETKQADFAATILEKGAEADKNLSLKRKVIRNIRVVTLDYSENKIAACVDEVLHTAPNSDEAVLTRTVMKLLAGKKTTTSTKKTPIQKHKAEIPKHGKVHHGIKKSAASTDSWERRFTTIVVFH